MTHTLKSHSAYIRLLDSAEDPKIWRSKWDRTLKLGILRWPLIGAIWEAH